MAANRNNVAMDALGLVGLQLLFLTFYCSYSVNISTLKIPPTALLSLSLCVPQITLKLKKTLNPDSQCSF